jgi:hypothetical protein
MSTGNAVVTARHSSKRNASPVPPVRATRAQLCLVGGASRSKRTLIRREMDAVENYVNGALSNLAHLQRDVDLGTLPGDLGEWLERWKAKRKALGL